MKKKLHRLLSMLMIVMMLVSMIPANAETGTATSKGTNLLKSGANYVEKENVGSTVGYLRPYIHTIKETSNDGNMSASLEIEYQIPANALVDGDGKLIQTWYFTRQDIQLGSWGNDMNKSGFVTSGGKAIGTYEIEGDKFVISFYNKADDYFLYTSSKSANGIIGDLKCWGNWILNENENGDVITKQFGDDTYTIYPHGMGNLDGSKSVSKNYDPLTGTVEWKIEVTSTEGVLDDSNILIKDTMPNGFTLEKIEVQYQGGSRQVMDSANYKVEGNVITIILPDLQYANGATQKHTVWITTNVPADVASSNNDQKNKAEFTYTKYDNKPYSFSKEATVKMQGTMVEKSVALQQHLATNPGYLKWTIVVNKNNVNIAGMHIEDTMLGSTTMEDLSISPTNGAAYDRNTKRINFTATSNGVNTNKYTITYYTRPTESAGSADSYSYDKNTVYLKHVDKEIAKDDAEYDWKKNTIGSIEKTKQGTYNNKTNRRFGYQIVVNPNYANIGNVTNLEDYLMVNDQEIDDLPEGFTFEASKVEYWKNGTKLSVSQNLSDYSSLDALMRSLMNRINEETVGGKNYNRYAVRYYVTVDKHATGSFTNYAQITSSKMEGSDNTGNQSYTGIPYDFVSKSAGGVQYQNNRIKWTVTINPEFQTLSNEFTVTDWLGENSQPSNLLTNPKQTVVVTPASGTAATYEYTYGTLAELFSQVSSLARQGVNSKLEVTYYTSIEKLGTVQNWIQLNEGETNAQKVEQTVAISLSVDKNDNSNAGVVLESDGTYKLTWNGKITLPYNWSMPDQSMTIEDTFHAEQYLTDNDESTLEAALAAALSMTAAEVKDKINYTHNGGNGFSLTLDHVPSAPSGATASGNVAFVYFTYSTHISAEDFARVGLTRNTLKQTIGSVEASDYEDSAYPAKLKVEKKFDNTLEIETGKADAEKLGWQISFTVPGGTSGKDFYLEDALPDHFLATRVKINVNNNNIYDVSNGSGSFGGGNSGQGLTVTSSRTFIKAKFAANHKCKANDVITMYVSGKVGDMDGFFTDGVVTQSMKNTVTAYVNMDNEKQLQDTDEASITVKKPDKKLVVDKTGKKLTDEINTVEYSVKINTEGKKFLSANDAMLNAVDTLTWSGNSSANKNSFVLDTNSVKLYEYNNGARGALWTNWSWDVVERDNARVITMQIPDGKAFELVYRYQVMTDNGSLNNLTITNRFQLNGEEYGGGDDSTITQNFIKDAIATARTDAITFFKFEKNNANVVLPNAEFKLEKYQDGWKNLGPFKTNDEGKLEVTGVEYVENVLYRVTETKAPVGYVLDDVPFYFSFGVPSSMPSPAPSFRNLAMGVQHYLYNAPESTSISIIKNWNDMQNKWGLRPSQITITAYPTNSDNPLFKKTVTVSTNNTDTWTATIDGLRKKDYDGTELIYAVREDEVVYGYTKAENGYTINNTLETVDIPVRKVWDDNHNQDNLRSQKIELTLYRKAEGESTATESGKVELPTNNAATSTADVWEYTFTNLPKYNAAGKEYVYSISEETVPAGYDVAYTKDGTVLVATNKHTPATVDINGTKEWNDGDNASRPTNVTIKLLADGKAAKDAAGNEITTTATKDGNWSWSFTNLPKYKIGAVGQLVDYSVEEVPVNGYASEVTGSAADGFTITNTQLTTVSGSKTWYGKEPAANTILNITLMSKVGNGDPAEVASNPYNSAFRNPIAVVKKDGTWNWSFTNLPKYTADKQEIKYSVVESAVSGYVTTYPAGTYNVTNIELTDITATKVWEDDSDRDGVRPTEIYLRLQQTVNGKTTDYTAEPYDEPVEVTGTGNSWTYEFTDLPAYTEDGAQITYTVVEQDAAKDGETDVSLAALKYATSYSADKLTVTNTREFEKITVSGEKTWNDFDDQDRIRPESITVNLMADGKKVEGKTATVTPDKDGKWSYTFKDLPKYKDGGDVIVYSVVEETVKKYTAGKGENAYDIVNTYRPETVDIEGAKTWVDGQPADAERAAIEITLYAGEGEAKTKVVKDQDGNAVINPVTVDADDDWKYAFKNLPKKAAGVEIKYSIEEKAITGYETDINGYDVTNTLLTSVGAVKSWIDGGATDENRPQSITIKLLADGKQAKDVDGNDCIKTVTANDDWSWTFTKLPVYASADASDPIVYTVAETVVPVGYKVSYQGTAADGYTIVNTLQTEVPVEKKWADGKANHANTAVTVQLMQDGVEYGKPVSLNDTNNWKHTFTDLPMYKSEGVAYKYEVKETNVPSGYEVTYLGDAAKGYTVVNTLLTDIPVEKVWEDEDDQDALRPNKIGIDLKLYRKVGEAKEFVEEVHLDENNVVEPDLNSWKHTFENLPKYDLEGNLYTYWVEEQKGSYLEGYIKTEDGLTVTNCHEPAMVDLSGEKTWVDEGNEDQRPAQITITLYGDGAVVTEDELEQPVNPIVIQRADFETASWSFTNLPKYKNVDGKAVEIQYEVKETLPDGTEYTIAYSNARKDGNFVSDVTNTIEQKYLEVAGKKIWQKDGYTEAYTVPAIDIQLLRDGEVIATYPLASVEIAKGVESKELTYKFEHLPMYAVPCTELASYEGDMDGHTFVYTVKEVLPESHETEDKKVFTSAEAENKTNGLDFTNTLKTVDVKGTKTWIYYGDQELTELYPELTIQLYANGKLVEAHTQTLKVGDTAYAIENLPEYDKDGNKIEYTVKEVVEAKYAEGFFSPDGVNNATLGKDFTNTLKTVNVSGKKIWDGNKNTITEVPTIKIELLRNGTVIDTATLENGDTTYAFNNLPKYAVPCDALKNLPADELTGKEFTYTVREVIVVENEDVAFDASSVKTEPETKDGSFTEDFTNKILTTSVSGKKTWNDNGNSVTHPDVVIELYRDKEEKAIATRTLKHGEENYIFEDLPLYAVAKTADANGYTGYTGAIDGHKFEYTVKEVVPHGYTSVQTNTDFTNTLEVVEVKGTKTWIDLGNEDQRPETITINLMRDGKEYKDVVIEINEADKTYDYSFADLPKYAIAGLADAMEGDKLDGHEFEYTVTEDVVTDYDAAINGYDVTNTISQKFTELEGKKTWIDGDDEAEKRPASIIIRLYRDGEQIDVATVTEETGWAWKFEKLAVYGVDVEDKGNYTYEDADGHTFVYTVTEDAVADYTTIQSGNSFTNTIEQKYTDVIGDKTWIDFENEDGKRPETITINLLRDGVEIDEVTVGEAEGWHWEFKDLPVYAVEPIDGKPVVYPYESRDGHTFKYTVTEDEVDQYTTEVEGFDVENTLVQEYVEVSGAKTWVDPTGTVHDPITINLLRDGVEIDEIVLNNGVVTYTFDTLPKYAVPCDDLAEEGNYPYTGAMDGHIFTYTVTEDLVPGYTTVQNGTNFTNTIEQDFIPVTITKIWMDNGAVGVEHPTITVRLLRNGTEIASATLADGVTSHTFTNMLRYNLTTGQPYVYTVTEDPVEGYDTAINGLTITNTTQAPEMITVSGTKTWSGDNGREHDNASEVKITLTRRVAGGKVEVVDAPIVWDGATYSFNNLLKEDENGRTYIYTIREDEVEGYDAYYQGYDINNRLRYDVVTVDVAGTKHWNDNNDAAGIRPEQVVVQLLRDGTVIDTVAISAAENWSYSFNDLPDNDGYGHYYTYTVAEQLVPGYWLRVEGNDLYNTREEFRRMRFGNFREEELEELLDIFDYGVPLWGGLLGTGDEIPVYPFAFGGLGLLALVAFLLYNRKRNRT